MEIKQIENLEEKARQIRVEILKMIAAASSGHPGGSLSIADIVSVLYFNEMNVDPANPLKEDRDRIVLSKGHTAPALYAALALKGFFPVEDLSSLRQVDSHLQGHPNRLDTPGVDASTGSLGQGLSMAAGMAIGNRASGIDANIYAILGDGEIQEGQIWEAAMTASHQKLSNLCAFLDNNNLQIDGTVEEVKNIYPLKEKWEAFGWNVIEIDGHSIAEIADALEKFKAQGSAPTMIIARTVKGKGVSFMENQVGFHGVAPNAEELEKALKELNNG